MAVAVLATGAVLSVRNAVHAVGHVRDGYHQITPGTVRSVQLPAHRELSVYAVWLDGSRGGRQFDATSDADRYGATAPPRPKTTVTVTGPGGGSIDYRDRSGGSNSTIQVNDKNGLRIGEFTTDRAGTYRVLVEFPAGADGTDRPALAAITSFSLLGELRDIAVPGLLGFLLGMTIIVVTAVRRGAAKRRRRQGVFTAPVYSPPLPVAPGSSAPPAPPAYRAPPPPPDLPGQRGPFL